MTLGNVLNTAIGLMLVYLLLSMIVSSVQESINTFLNKRGEDLFTGISALLASNQGASSVLDTVLHHPVINSGEKDKKPSYVAARSFSTAVLDVLQTGSAATPLDQIRQTVADLPEGDARTALVAFVKEAGDDLDALKKRIEIWFDDSMDRLSGTYKRHIRRYNFLLGAALTVALNVNTLQIGATMWHSPAAQQALADAAERAIKNDPKAATDTVDKLVGDLLAFPLPMGWYADQQVCRQIGLPVDMATKNCLETTGIWIVAIVKLLLGWLITMLAVSLGASFWFDTLKNVMNIRAAGPVPPRTGQPPARTS